MFHCIIYPKWLSFISYSWWNYVYLWEKVEIVYKNVCKLVLNATSIFLLWYERVNHNQLGSQSGMECSFLFLFELPFLWIFLEFYQMWDDAPC